MLTKQIFIVSALIMCVSWMLAKAQSNIMLGTAENSPQGIWLTLTKDAAIEFYPCEQNQFCGRVAWLADPYDENGEILRDPDNPDPSLRNRLRCGMPIITGLTLDDDGWWSDGNVYDPDDGKDYGVKIHRDAPDQLTLRGYLWISLLGSSQIWHLAPNNLKLCPPD